MGSWGPGLYSSDIAKDLKSTVAAVVSLPFEGERLVEILEETFPEASRRPDDEDHTTFWLVVADQFHKLGIEVRNVFDRAVEIIESGQDAELQQHQEMSAGDQRKRSTALVLLRDRLSTPVPTRKRKTLSKPQPLVMNRGDVLVFPLVDSGVCFNPYFAKAKWERAAWGAATIIQCGHVFEYLAYYCPIIVKSPIETAESPSFESLQGAIGWRLRRPGTCSPTHFKRMQLQVVGGVEIDSEQLANRFPNMREGRYAAINDISIANSFHVGYAPKSGPDDCIESLSEIA